jgi:hypothetical protein
LARQENQTPIADIAKAKIFRLLRKYPLTVASWVFWVPKKEKGGYYLLKT